MTQLDLNYGIKLFKGNVGIFDVCFSLVHGITGFNVTTFVKRNLLDS